MTSKDQNKYNFTFEARNFRFISLRRPSFLNEIIFGPITTKHFIALMIVVVLLGIGWNILIVRIICSIIGLFALACALYPPRALTLETTLWAFIKTLWDMLAYSEKREKRVVILEKIDRDTEIEIPKTVKVNNVDVLPSRRITITDILNAVNRRYR